VGLALLGAGVPSAHGQQVVSSPAFNNPAGPDGTVGTADDDYRPNKPAGSDLVDAAQSGAGLADALDIDGDGNTSEPIPGPFATADRDNGSGPDLGMAESTGSALPVELTSLSAQLRSGTGPGGTPDNDPSVVLTWRTASETGNAGFELQRLARGGDASGDGASTEGGANGGGWTTVGQVEGAGTTTQPQRYRFVDERLPFGAERLAYRLRQIDVDGSATITDSVVVERRGPEGLVLGPPAPNPTGSEAAVRVGLPSGAEGTAGAEGPARLRLFDLMGRLVRSYRISTGDPRQVVRVGVYGLTSGTYLLRLEGPAGSVRSRRLTVVK
jgi:hypothetical protein